MKINLDGSVSQKLLIVCCLLFISGSILSAEEDALPKVDLRLDKNRIILTHEKNNYFYPLSEQGIKQLETGYDLNENGKTDYIIGVQLFDGPDKIPFGMILIAEKEARKLKTLYQVGAGDSFQKFQVVSIGDGKDAKTWLLVWGTSGAHHDELKIIAFQNGQFVRLLDKGSAAGVDFKYSDKGGPQVWIGRENWADPNWNYADGKRLWEVYQWEASQFAYEKALSTSPLLSEFEAVQEVVEKYKSLDKP